MYSHTISAAYTSISRSSMRRAPRQHTRITDTPSIPPAVVKVAERDGPHNQTNNDTDELHIQFVDFYFKIRLMNPLYSEITVCLIKLATKREYLFLIISDHPDGIYRNMKLPDLYNIILLFRCLRIIVES